MARNSFSTLPNDNYNNLLDNVDNKVIVDSQTGLKFKRTKKPKRKDSIQQRPMSPITPPPPTRGSFFQHKATIDDHIPVYQSAEISTQQTYSVYSTESSAASSIIPTETLPSHSVPNTDYYKFLPKNLPQVQKIRQLIIWLASTTENNTRAKEYIDPEAQRVHLIAKEMKRKFIQKLISGDIGVSWLLRPDKQSYQQGQRHPVNVANEERLKRLEENIQIFKDELDDWNTCTSKVMKLHADYNDTIQSAENTMEYEDIDIDSINDHLDDAQREFLNTYCVKSNTQPVLERLEYGVLGIKYNLDTARALVDRTSNYTQHRFRKLALHWHECNRLVPIEEDKDPYDDTSIEDKIESEKQRTKDIVNLMRKISDKSNKK